MLASLQRIFDQDPQRWTKVAAEIKGVTEETTTGVHRLYQFAEQGQLLFPAINVNDSVTKSKFDNKYGCRHSLIDGINRATDVLIGGKIAVVCGYGDVGKGCAESLRGQRARVVITEIDPICALQAAMDGYQVVQLEDVLHTADIFVTATGNKDVITAQHMAGMKHQAIVGNIGHFDNEIDMAGLAGSTGSSGSRSSRRSTSGCFPDGHSIIVLSEGRLLNLGNATGHPSFVMSNSFTNQVIAQIELFGSNDEYDKQVYTLSKQLDEKVARLHLDALGIRLTELTAGSGGVPRHPRRGPLQVRPLPLLAGPQRRRSAERDGSTSIPPHEVADLGLADEGQARIEWAGEQMPVLGQIRERMARQQPLKGVRVAACLHVTSETANLILTLQAGGASTALCSANPLSTQDDVASALVVEHGVEVRALHGEDLDTYAEHVRALVAGPEGGPHHDRRRRRPADHRPRARRRRAQRSRRRHRGDHHRAGAPAAAAGRGAAGLSGARGQRGPHRAGAQRPPRDRPVGDRRDHPRQPRAARRPHAWSSATAGRARGSPSAPAARARL